MGGSEPRQARRGQPPPGFVARFLIHIQKMHTIKSPLTKTLTNSQSLLATTQASGLVLNIYALMAARSIPLTSHTPTTHTGTHQARHITCIIMAASPLVPPPYTCKTHATPSLHGTTHIQLPELAGVHYVYSSDGLGFTVTITHRTLPSSVVRVIRHGA